MRVCLQLANPLVLSFHDQQRRSEATAISILCRPGTEFAKKLWGGQSLLFAFR